MKKQLATVGITLVILVSGGAAACATLSDSGQGIVGSPAAGASISTPSPKPATPLNSRSNIDAELSREAPALQTAIAAVEASDVNLMFGLMTWKQFPCTAGSVKGGIAPKCTDLGLAAGTMVRMFHYELLASSYFTEEQMRQRLAPLLSGQTPTLGLVAERPDGTGIVSYTVSDAKHEGLRGIDFIVDFKSPTPLVGYTERFVSSTPLDTIREDQLRKGLPAAQILYVSPAMLVWEREKDGAQRNPIPGPGVTASP